MSNPNRKKGGGGKKLAALLVNQLINATMPKGVERKTKLVKLLKLQKI